MTIDDAVHEMLEAHGMHQFNALARDLAVYIERYGIAMHDRGNFHRKPWGYVPEDRQEKARHAAVEAFTGGER